MDALLARGKIRITKRLRLRNPPPDGDDGDKGAQAHTGSLLWSHGFKHTGRAHGCFCRYQAMHKLFRAPKSFWGHWQKYS